MPAKGIKIFSKPGCPFCDKAKRFLQELKLNYTTVTFDPNSHTYLTDRDNLFSKYNHKSFPVIILENQENDMLIGGYTDMVYAYDTLRLHRMLSDIGVHLEVNLDF